MTGRDLHWLVCKCADAPNRFALVVFGRDIHAKARSKQDVASELEVLLLLFPFHTDCQLPWMLSSELTDY
jgi:hypothetical protein